MAKVRCIVIDKTGTLTGGRAKIVSVLPCSGLSRDELLTFAGSLDQASRHVIAQIIVAEARNRELRLVTPTDVKEAPGEGIQGRVNGQEVSIGSVRFVASRLPDNGAIHSNQNLSPGAVVVAVAVDHKIAGTLILADELRSGVETLLLDLRAAGIKRIVLATGDRRDVADGISAGLPIDAIRTELTPDQKVTVVKAERKYGPVMMIGDGINDAPALAAADIGVAMGANGAAAAAEVADVNLFFGGPARSDIISRKIRQTVSIFGSGERLCRHRSLDRRYGRSRAWAHHAGSRRFPSGSHRRRCHR